MIPDRLLSLERKLRLIFRPINDFEKHSALEPFAFEISGVLFPVRGLANAKSSFLTLVFERIVGRQGTADALVHHGEAVVGEGLIVHRPSPYPLACDSLLRYDRDDPTHRSGGPVFLNPTAHPRDRPSISYQSRLF